MKKFSLLLIMALAALSITAQEQRMSDKTVYFSNAAKDNWFLSLGGGTNMYVTKDDNKADFMKRLGWMGKLSVGRWYDVNWGARASLSAGSITHNGSAAPDWWAGKDKNQWKNSFIHAQFDLMYNLGTGLGGYNPDRFYNMFLTAGPGYIYGMTDKWKKVHAKNPTFESQNQSLTWNVGLVNNFRLAKNLSLFIELGYMLVQESWDFTPVNGTWEWDGIGTAVAGLTFGLGGRQEFTPAELMDYNLINDLNSQINRLRAENEQLSKRPEFCPECPEVEPAPAVESVYVPNVVFFRLDSYKIDRNQQISIHNTAEYLKANPNATVKVVAYADKLTGYPEYNMKLSERRAKAVADALTAEYGIDSSRISVDWKGDTEQPYEVNEWNRVAIFLAD